MSPTGSDKKTRAEQVRARRQIERIPKKPIARQLGRPAKSAIPPTKVTARRGGTTPTGRMPSSNSSYKRKVYMRLDTPGAEIRLPSLPNFQFGWRLASGMIALVMLVSIIAMREMPAFLINKINLIGAKRVPGEEIASTLDIIDTPIIEIIPSQLENMTLKAFHDLKTAIVKVGLPAMISMTVEERIPAVLWMTEDDQSMWIDQEGFMFPVRGEATLPVSVLALGEPPRPFVAANELEDNAGPTIDPVLTFVPTPDVDPVFIMAILSLRDIVPAETSMLYDPQYGLGWHDPRGWLVYFGMSTEKMDQKLSQYTIIVQELQAKNIQPALISLEFLHAPFYRLEQ